MKQIKNSVTVNYMASYNEETSFVDFSIEQPANIKFAEDVGGVVNTSGIGKYTGMAGCKIVDGKVMPPKGDVWVIHAITPERMIREAKEIIK